MTQLLEVKGLFFPEIVKRTVSDQPTVDSGEVSRDRSVAVAVISRPGRSKGLLYEHLCDSVSLLCENIFTAPPRPNG